MNLRQRVLSITAFLGALSAPVVAHAARVVPAKVSASSAYPEENGISYQPDRTTDAKATSAWVEGEQGSGLGSWIEYDLGDAKTIAKVRVWGGLWYSTDYWGRANRPRDLEISFSDGSKQVVTLKDEMKAQEFILPAAVKTSVVRLKVKSIYDGNTWLDTAISEVQLFDTEPETVTTRAVLASSTLAPDGDGNYDPKNAVDGLNDSMWCEGDKAGDGTGAWLEVDLGAKTTVSNLVIVNGIGSSLPVWMKANRAGTATLTFSDGATESLTLKNSMMPQTLTFPAHSTSKVKVTFSGIVNGKEYNDLCMSELRFGS